MTTNYDNLIEVISGKDVIHLHGEYTSDVEEYVFNQNLSIEFDNKIYGVTDITIGDYFLFKVFLPITNRFMAGNKRIVDLPTKFKEAIGRNHIQTLVIFGLNIENDQHIIRNYMLELFHLNIENPRIVYCYFTEEEKKSFNDMFERVTTFREDVNDYCRNIEILYIKTQDLLERFYK